MKIIYKPGRGVGRTTEAAEYAKSAGAYLAVVNESIKSDLLKKGYENVLTHEEVLESRVLIGRGDIAVVFDDAEVLLRVAFSKAGSRVWLIGASLGRISEQGE